jgi:hypothetical protein
MVLLFDIASECLKLSIGGGGGGGAKAGGAVSALAFDRTGSRLLVGTARGNVHLVDITRGRIALSVASDRAHQAGRGVLHLAFTTSHTTVIVVDSGGSVFELRLRRNRESRLECVFSGCHGEVCTIAPLWPNSTTNSDLYFDANLLAMATLTKVMVIRLKSPTRMIFACALSGAHRSPPIIGWQWMPIQVCNV